MNVWARLGNITSQDFDILLRNFGRGFVVSTSLRNTCWSFCKFTKVQFVLQSYNLIFSAILRKTSANVAQKDVEVLAREIPPLRQVV